MEGQRRVARQWPQLRTQAGGQIMATADGTDLQKKTKVSIDLPLNDGASGTWAQGRSPVGGLEDWTMNGVVQPTMETCKKETGKLHLT